MGLANRRVEGEEGSTSTSGQFFVEVTCDSLALLYVSESLSGAQTDGLFEYNYN